MADQPSDSTANYVLLTRRADEFAARGSGRNQPEPRSTRMRLMASAAAENRVRRSRRWALPVCFSRRNAS
jgi:hypothetical protein